jgi:hypothetical protein
LLEKAIQTFVPSQLGIKFTQQLLIFNSVDRAAKQNRPDYSMTRQGTPNSHLLIVEGFLVNNVWEFCDKIPTVLRVHVAPQMELNFVCHEILQWVHQFLTNGLQ